MQKLFGFKHVIFIAVVVFLSLWTWMLRYEVMRLEGSGRFLLDRFTGKTYIAGRDWREIKTAPEPRLISLDDAFNEVFKDRNSPIEKPAQNNKKTLSEEYEEFLKERSQHPQSADSTNRRTTP